MSVKNNKNNVKRHVLLRKVQMFIHTRYLSDDTLTRMRSSPTLTFSPSDLCLDAGWIVHQHASPATHTPAHLSPSHFILLSIVNFTALFWLPVESSCRPTSNASLSVRDRDVVKQLRYCSRVLERTLSVHNKELCLFHYLSETNTVWVFTTKSGQKESLECFYSKMPMASKVWKPSFVTELLCLTMPECVCLSRMACPYNSVRWPPPCDDLE